MDIQVIHSGERVHVCGRLWTLHPASGITGATFLGVHRKKIGVHRKIFWKL